MYYKDEPKYKDGNFTMFPNEAFSMDLSMGEICVYLYLLYREDRKTYTCYPSLTTIADALQTTKPTVRKYVSMLENKGLISTEATTIRTKKYGNIKGNLKYTIHPIKKVADAFFDRQIRIQEAKLKAQQALKKYEKKREKMVSN